MEHRVWQHNSGVIISTKGKGPWRIIFKKEFFNKSEAYEYERYLKSLKSSKYIRECIIGV
ncbi:MAG: GIY-YIG nuclease family protein [Patescibacteria group bacterium]|nr:GIY-YIG nuclease family protein [Patescibacteria group bacterium]